MVQEVSTSPPSRAVDFAEHDATEFSIFLQADFDPPEKLTVRLRPWWPFQPVSVAGTGAGVDFGGGGGGEGGGWPGSGGHGGGGGGHGGGGHDGGGGGGH